MEGLIGKKIGMTQVFDDQGRRIPVTVIEVGPCPVVQVKTTETDGYNAVQLGFEEQKPHRMTKSMLKHFEKATVKPCRITREFPLAEGEEVKAGENVTVGIFDDVKYVDVSGISKGRGFSGVIRRYRFAGGQQTHGGHSKRRVGSIGACEFPGEVQKGKKMPGHMGSVNRKARNLTVVQVRGEDNLLLVRGSIPGPKNGVVIIKKALKK
ncbi:MAG: 50S ribosomal protein L3 [Kiritimatiellae bacterium]|jgi:large subunit ribosomal protein L3|nr:50S ribosomal protein L3 [Kiritimatiellia bacterium]